MMDYVENKALDTLELNILRSVSLLGLLASYDGSLILSASCWVLLFFISIISISFSSNKFDIIEIFNLRGNF